MIKHAVIFWVLVLAAASERFRDHLQKLDKRSLFKFEDTCGKTPTNLEDEFYQNCVFIGIPPPTCEQAWGAFKGAFADKDPATVIPR